MLEEIVEVSVVVCEDEYKVFGRVWNEYSKRMCELKENEFGEYMRLYNERNEVCGVKENVLFN